MMKKPILAFWVCMVFGLADSGAATLDASATANVADLDGDTGEYAAGGVGGFQLTQITIDNAANVGLMQFQIAPEALTITSARLRLYLDSADVEGFSDGIEFGVYRNSTPWWNVTTNWDDRPTVDSTPLAVFTVMENQPGQVDVLGTGIVTVVQSWFNGADNFGLTLQRTDSSGNPIDPRAVFFSDVFDVGNGSVGFKPQLIFEAVAVPLPAALPLMLAGLGTLGTVMRRRRPV